MQVIRPVDVCEILHYPHLALAAPIPRQYGCGSIVWAESWVFEIGLQGENPDSMNQSRISWSNCDNLILECGSLNLFVKENRNDLEMLFIPQMLGQTLLE